MSNKVSLSADGPLHFTGTVELLSADGQPIRREHDVWLCRCGASRNKPYCDGAHKTLTFRDAGMPAKTTLAESTAATALRVTLRADGPLKCVGPLEVLDAQGSTIWRGTDTALCRCGASAKKPFCDGSHRQIGFKA